MTNTNPVRRGRWRRLIGLCLFLAATGALGQDCAPDALSNGGPTRGFTDNGDGTLTHTATGLVWKRCSEGQTWDGTICAGKASTHNWQEAEALADRASDAGTDDWRLPSLQELSALVEKACSNPAIDPGLFPDTPAGIFWSSTPDGENPDYAWYVHFRDGHGMKAHKDRGAYVRLVRGGQ